MEEKKSIMRYIDIIEEKFLVYSFILTVGLIFVQVIMRAVGSSLTWSEELARYLFIWQCWVGVSFAQRFGKHIKIEMIVMNLPKKIRKVIDILAILLTLGIVVFLVIYGAQMVAFLFELGTKSTAMRIPMALVYLAMPLSCLIYGIRLVQELYCVITGKEVTTE